MVRFGHTNVGEWSGGPPAPGMSALKRTLRQRLIKKFLLGVLCASAVNIPDQPIRAASAEGCERPSRSVVVFSGWWVTGKVSWGLQVCRSLVF